MTFRHLLSGALHRTGFAVVAVLALAAQAGAAPLMNLSDAQRTTVRQIGNYVSSLATLQGRFTQLGPNGEFTEGTFFLQRPGKMRFEYAPPNPVLVVADGFWVGIEDRKKKRTEKYPLSATPLNLLLDEKVDLLQNARIVGFEESDEAIAITLEDQVGDAPGQLTLYFGKPDLALKQWTVIDAQGLTTQVSFFDLVSGTKLNQRLFLINDHLEIDHSSDRK